jgi:hypothetical protein
MERHRLFLAVGEGGHRQRKNASTLESSSTPGSASASRAKFDAKERAKEQKNVRAKAQADARAAARAKAKLAAIELEAIDKQEHDQDLKEKVHEYKKERALGRKSARAQAINRRAAR